MKIFQIFLLLFVNFAFSKKHKHNKGKGKAKAKELDEAVQVAPSLSVQIPVIKNVIGGGCRCGDAGPCRPSIYADYYYNPPYTGYPANSSYLPPPDSIPEIIARLKSIRDTTKKFVDAVKQEESDIKQALYVKNNFDSVLFILQAVSKAANDTNSHGSLN